MTFAPDLDTSWTPVKVPAGPQRPYLVVVRSGKSSLHQQWQQELRGQERNWDLLLSHYDDSDINPEGGDIIVRQGAFKFSASYRMFQDIAWLRNYQAVWFCDDDIMTSWEDINHLFNVFSAYDLLLAQPTLTHDSYWYHPITLNRTDTLVRFSNFAEIMAPLFSMQALQTCLPSFKNIVAGWGLDWLWPKMLGQPRNKIALIDMVTVRHTRPVASGPTYSDAKKVAVSAADEMRYIMNTHGLTMDILEYGVIHATPKPINREQRVASCRSTISPFLEAFFLHHFGISQNRDWIDFPCGFSISEKWQNGHAIFYGIPPFKPEDPALSFTMTMKFEAWLNKECAEVLQIGTQRDSAQLIMHLNPFNENGHSFGVCIKDAGGREFLHTTPYVNHHEEITILAQFLPAAGWVRWFVNGQLVDNAQYSSWAWAGTDRIWLGSKRLHAEISNFRIAPFLTEFT